MLTLSQFKLRVGETSAPDDLLRDILREARDYILTYTGRREDRWLPGFNSVQAKIGLIIYNRMGIEGVQARTEGGISTSLFSSGADYPDSITKLLDRYRVAKVV